MRPPARSFRFPVLLAVIAAVAMAAPASGGMDVFRDPEDGHFDLSQFLLERKGALPIPIFITEPAVGYGGGGALVFFQQSLAERARTSEGHYRPPNIYVGAGLGTENGTWAGAGGGMVSFADDRWRLRGGGGYAHANLDFFGIGATSGDSPASYSLEGYGIAATGLYRLRRTQAWLALNLRYLDLETRFEAGPVAALLDGERTSSGIGPAFEYDSRDNLFTPGRGWLGSAEAMFYGTGIGSDASYQTYAGHAYVYVPVRSFVLGTRVDARAASDATPFYMMPYISIRGIPAVRYQGRYTALIEEEARWNLTSRWALVGFYGAGRAWGEHLDFADAETHGAGGTGFRYLLARKLGLYSGVDFAWGPDFALYLQFGSAWH